MDNKNQGWGSVLVMLGVLLLALLAFWNWFLVPVAGFPFMTWKLALGVMGGLVLVLVVFAIFYSLSIANRQKKIISKISELTKKMEGK